MENASDALIMAADMLIFIVALTLCISSFSNVRQGVDNIINRPETIKMAKDSEGYINYIKSDKSKATRVVGVETVVPTLYRAIKENYVVYIKFKGNLPNCISANSMNAQKTIKIKKDNGDEVSLINSGDKIYMFKAGEDPLCNSNINKLLYGTNGRNGLYSVLYNYKFNEYLGEFKYDTNANVEDRITYRIITYIQN